MTPPVVTGLDLPSDAPGGSVELFYDLYAAPGAPLSGQAFMLRPAGSGPRRPSDQLTLLDGPGKCVEGTPFRHYVTALAECIAAAIRPPEGAVAHLQHLAFGASPALIAAFPGMTRIALVHGTDLLFAQEHPTQHQVLQQVIAAAAAIVVPTAAMADQLARLAPQLDLARVVHIPWGVPDQLLHAPQPPAGRSPGGDLRLLYAGRLTAEKGAGQLITACQRVPGIRLSIAAPRQEYATLSTRMDLQDAGVTYLGWLPRTQMWKAFADHDLLIVPSTTLEAFGLVAVEAQASGLPVVYQPVPGLREILGGSALAVDLSIPGTLASELSLLRRDDGALAELRDAGLRNAARYPLRATAQRLADLGEQLTRTPGSPGVGSASMTAAHSADGIAAPIQRLIQRGVDTCIYPGAVWAAGDATGQQVGGALGLLDPADPSAPMTAGTVFDMASLTKIVAVWAGIGTLWGDRQLTLDDPLAALMPSLADYPLGPVTVRQLLTHTAGVPLRANLRALYGTEPRAIRDGVLHEQLHRPPGQAVEYTDRAALILGFLIEHLSGRRLDVMARQHVWEPLGMTETAFGPLPPSVAARGAPTEYDQDAGARLKGTAHDFSARLLDGVCGVSGVFSTLADTRRFLRYMLSPAASSGTPGFGPAWVAESLQIHTGEMEPARGLFWLPAPGTDPTDGTWVHYGFTGTGMWISPKQQRWAVLLTNRLYYSRDRQPLTDIRNTFRELAFA